MFVKIFFELLIALLTVYGAYMIIYNISIFLFCDKSSKIYLALKLDNIQKLDVIETKIINAEDLIKNNSKFSNELIVLIEENKINRDDLKNNFNTCSSFIDKHKNIKYYFVD